MSKKKEINWLHETKTASGVGVKVAFKIFQVIVNVLITVLLIAALTGIIVVCAFSIYIKNYVDTDIDVSQFKAAISSGSTTTSIYRYDFTDRENRIGTPVLMEEEKIVGGTDSTYVTYDKIPENMINAVIAIEDKRFRTHQGVDWKRTIAAGANFFIGFADSGYGGSTITQQLIKNITGSDDYKIQRKVQEIFWALDLETKMDKTEIIELYLNVVSFGGRNLGVQAAAYNYFSKDVSELTLIECAAIAGITQNPSYYNPITFPEHNAQRRNDVLYEMYDQGLITKREFDEAYKKELVLNIPGGDDKDTNGVNSWYVDMVIEDVINDLVEKKGYTRKVASLMVYNGGLNIYILEDPNIQSILEKVYLNDKNFPAATSGMRAQSSAIIIDSHTGDILGVVGSRDKKTANRIQNYATQTKRPPGSSIKPMAVYAPAFEEGLITWSTVIDDTPFNFTSSATGWPKDAYAYRGLTPINYAVAHSLNTTAVKVLDMVGLRKSYEFCHNTLNMSCIIDELTLESGRRITDIDYAALALGQLNYGINVREITAAYSIFANNGIYNEPHSYLKVTDSEGNTVLENKYKGTVAISEGTASVMTLMMEDVIESGTADTIRFKEKTGIDVAGKTGTAGDTYDRWFIGYTPYYICGLWYGYDYPRTLKGSNPCLSLFDTVMVEAHQQVLSDVNSGRKALRKFDISDNIVSCTYCIDSGKLVSEACSHDPRGDRTETGYFVKGTEPTEYCDTHVLVNYDAVTKGVACDFCPEENLIQVALVKVNRDFPVQLYITDAQYSYVELPYDVRPYSSKSYPYYYNLTLNRGDGRRHYYGRTRNGVYNHACIEHFNLAAWKELVAERKAH
ncbi:MAG: transglycosylase domain-containing protein [Clostridia bacterium]|nr:transglycosylase domain-containing protein [Clostridia bacterium]